MSKIRNLRKAIDYLIYKSLDDIDLDLSARDEAVTLRTNPYRITRTEEQRLKRVFGPLKPVKDEYNYTHKDLVGEVKLIDGLVLKFTLSSALSCKAMNPEDLTEDKWDDIKAAAKRGEISIPECKPADFKPEPEPMENPY